LYLTSAFNADGAEWYEAMSAIVTTTTPQKIKPKPRNAQIQKQTQKNLKPPPQGKEAKPKSRKESNKRTDFESIAPWPFAREDMMFSLLLKRPEMLRLETLHRKRCWVAQKAVTRLHIAMRTNCVAACGTRTGTLRWASSLWPRRLRHASPFRSRPSGAASATK
jgi:type IV secretory pathway VirB10-like protein